MMNTQIKLSFILFALIFSAFTTIFSNSNLAYAEQNSKNKKVSKITLLRATTASKTMTKHALKLRRLASLASQHTPNSSMESSQA